MSQIALHRLLAGFHATLTAGKHAPKLLSVPELTVVAAFGPSSSTRPGRPGSRLISPESSSAFVIKELSSELDQWRKMLPEHLQWRDDQSTLFSEHGAFSPSYAGPSLQSSLAFSPDWDHTGPSLSYAIDIQSALLQSRYFYSKYLIYRPFVFQALRQPELMSREDAEGAAECLNSALKWPIAMSPPRHNKRLIPCPFFWSRNLFGILILLHLASQHPVLVRVKTSFCGQNFERDAAETVRLYIDWLRDIQYMDASAMRYWEIVRLLYGLED